MSSEVIRMRKQVKLSGKILRKLRQQLLVRSGMKKGRRGMTGMMKNAS